MKEHDKFLETYRKIEQTLSKKNIKVQDYEEILNSNNKKDEADKLRLCRTFRNYLSHQDNATSFIAISPNMQSFLESILFDLDSSSTPVKKKMVAATKGLLESASVEDATKYLSAKKCSIVPFFDKNGNPAGVFGYKQLTKVITDGKSIKTTKLSAIKDVCAINTSNTKNANTTYIIDTDSLSVLSEISKDFAILITDKNDKCVGFLPNNL